MTDLAELAKNVDLTPEELQAFVSDRRQRTFETGREWGHFYELTANSLVMDTRPDYWKRVRDGTQSFRATGGDNGIQLAVQSLGHLVMYVLYGWETGIYNEFRHLQTRGFSKAHLMELVMYANLTSGIRGLQIVYNAVGKFLPDLPDGVGPLQLPASWSADPKAFKAGLDLSVRDLTEADRRNIDEWFEKNIGYTPKSARFAMKYHPEFYKWHRARWEIIFQKLPKQAAPYVMMRQNMIAGFKDALREAVLLGKAWGMEREWVLHGLFVSAWYTGFEGLYAANAAVDDILEGWD